MKKQKSKIIKTKRVVKSSGAYKEVNMPEKKEKEIKPAKAEMVEEKAKPKANPIGEPFVKEQL